MGRPGAFKSEKRKKELTRQKKQEQKRLRRLEKGSVSEEVPKEDGTIESAPEEQNPKTAEEKE